MSNIQLPRPITLVTVERAHAMAIAGQRRQELGFCEAGMRIARSKHPALLLALDKAANVLDHAAEDQSGRSRRDPGASRSEKVFPTEAALWREAYRLMDAGEPIQHFAWIYAAGAWLAGLHEGVAL